MKIQKKWKRWDVQKQKEERDRDVLSRFSGEGWSAGENMTQVWTLSQTMQLQCPNWVLDRAEVWRGPYLAIMILTASILFYLSSINLKNKLANDK
jgi:hypothetical protein